MKMLLAWTLMGATACSTSTQVFRSADGATGDAAPSDAGVVTVLPPPSPIDESCRSALIGPFESGLSTPRSVLAEPSDHHVRLTWDGAFDRVGDDVSPAVEGYRICFGTDEASLQHGVLSDDRAVDLLGIALGAEYVAIVQSVDALGRVSAPSEPIRFSADPSDVSTLRNEMTGFFDDFNVAGTAPTDERLWNVAFSQCNDDAVSHVYRRQQRMVSISGNNSQLPGATSSPCDRNQNAVRPRALFDFAGREGRIVFDLRSPSGRRSAWRLDVRPPPGNGDRTDIMGSTTVFAEPSFPGGGFRLAGIGAQLSLYGLDAEGVAVGVVSAEVAGPSLPMATVMRRVEVRVQRSRVSVLIDGEVVLERDGDIGFDRAQVLFSHIGVDPAKQGLAWSLMELDNFGFDGPAIPDNVRNYRGARGFGDRIETGGRESWTLMVPDPIPAEAQVRFFYSLQTARYRWDPADAILINGMALSIPEPLSPGWTWMTDLGGVARPYSASIEVPAGVFRRGANTIAIAAANSALINQHVEVGSSTSTAPFTPPSSYLSERVTPTLPPIAPFIAVAGIDGTCVSLDPMFFDGDNFEIRLPSPVSGTTRLSIATNTEAMSSMTGVNYGVARVELYVDGALHSAVDTAARVAAPAHRGGLRRRDPVDCGVEVAVDTTGLSNGPHQLSVRAYDAAGTRSRERYGFETPPSMGLEAGVTVPVLFEVAN